MTVVTNIEYLDRLELYQTEKPYVTTFEIPESVGKSTNHCYVSHEAEIQNAKQIKGDFSLDVHGFEFHDWPTKLQSADFENLDLITSSYYSEILQQMERAFPRAFTDGSTKKPHEFMGNPSAGNG
ncbi:MAG: hypothetical protein LQ351_002878 [Letrouitia transgressa]|nr:MAG: hypothetical protein LQ351_002878 [Letrouitia transgressa]